MNQISLVNIKRGELNAVDISRPVSRPVRRPRKNYDREENLAAAFAGAVTVAVPMLMTVIWVIFGY